MFTQLIIISLKIINCYCYAEYEIFRGFEDVDSTVIPSTEIITTIFDERNVATSKIENTAPSTDNTKINEKSTIIYNDNTNNTNPTIITISSGTTLSNYTVTPRKNTLPMTNSTPKTTNTIIKTPKYKCPEEERPKNIGSYEIPTQRDLVVFTKNTLRKLYDSYNQESMMLLNDIKEVTKAALHLESKCKYNKKLYKQCIKRVSKRCEQITKHLISNVEAQRYDVLAVTEDNICTLSGMKANPLHLIKLIAQEKSMLEFRLAGFLRFISACDAYCNRPIYSVKGSWKPIRHLTNQDLVVRHFLTKNNYIQLIKDSNHTLVG